MPYVIIRYEILTRSRIWRQTEIKKLQDYG